MQEAVYFPHIFQRASHLDQMFRIYFTEVFTKKLIVVYKLKLLYDILLYL